MLNRQALKRAGEVLLLLAAGATACQRNEPSQTSSTSKPSPTGTQSRDGAFWVSGWTYYIRPVKPGAPTDANNAKETWQNLFPGMAKDPKTRELLTKLHGGWPAELIAVDTKQAGDKSVFKADPPDGVAVVLRVADLNHKQVKTKAGSVPFREIAYGRVIRIKDAAIATLPLGTEEPLPGEALDLAIEDYVLRHAPGWVARQGTGPDTDFADDEQLRRSAEEAKLPPNVEDQRRELDQKIKDYADRAKAYYGAMSKP
ncbi:MAG: hypothetical protein ACJ8FY_03395 [Gemmataceae bacterium]